MNFIKKLLLVTCMMLFITNIAFASETSNNSDSNNKLYERYYNVIYNHIARTGGLSAEWSEWMAKSIIYDSAQYQVNPLLVTALFTQESGFNMASFSRTGAVGIAQLMPDTATAIGVDPYDPAGNILGGIIYLSQQLHTFQNSGDWMTSYAVAAYNAGPGAVKSFGGIPPYAETQNHLVRVGAIYLQLEKEFNQNT